MYSPKISEELIPDLYRLAKAMKKPMTKVVNNIIYDYLKEIKITEEEERINENITRVKKLYKIEKIDSDANS